MYVIKTEQGLYLDDSGQTMQFHSEEQAENYAELIKFGNLVREAEVIEDNGDEK